MDKITHHHGRKILCLGEIAWDRFISVEEIPRNPSACHLEKRPELEMPGGCALNTAVALAAAGVPVALAGNTVGKDSRGDAIAAYLARWSLDSRIRQRPEVRTPACEVLVERDTGQREFRLFHEGIALSDDPRVDELLAEARQGRYSMAFVDPYIRGMAERFLRYAQAINGLWILIQDEPPDSPLVPLADAIQVSVPSPACEGMGKTRFDPTEVFRFARQFAGKGRCQQVFATAGAEGLAWLRADGTEAWCPASTVAAKIVDTTGCGDAFRAGLLCGLAQGMGLDAAVALGQRFGAAKAVRRGSH